MSITIIDEQMKEVGKTIKASKKLWLWKFILGEDKIYTIELYKSKITGKKKVFQNGQLLFQNTMMKLNKNDFIYKFTIGAYQLMIL